MFASFNIYLPDLSLTSTTVYLLQTSNKTKQLVIIICFKHYPSMAYTLTGT